MAAISRMASAPCAAASTTWEVAIVKSLRSTGRETRARAFCRSRRLPWKKLSSVRIESAAAPPVSYCAAMRAASKWAESTPLLGEAFFTSAMMAGVRARKAARKSRLDAVRSSASRSHWGEGFAERSSWRFLATIRARMSGTVSIKGEFLWYQLSSADSRSASRLPRRLFCGHRCLPNFPCRTHPCGRFRLTGKSSPMRPAPSFHVYKQAHDHELVGEQCFILVVEHSFEFHSAGCRVNLIVDSRQTAGRDLYR